MTLAHSSVFIPDIKPDNEPDKKPEEEPDDSQPVDDS